MPTSQPSLRSDLIRLAHTNESIRPHLLPILREAKEDAEAQYQSRARQIGAFLRKIEQLLSKHVHEQRSEPQNWGFSGDLGYVQERLGEVIDFLGGEGAQQRVASSSIRKFLDVEDDIRSLSKVYQSEGAAESAIHNRLYQKGLEEAFRGSGPGGSQKWFLRTEDGDEVQEHLNVFFRPGPRPGWISLQVSL